MNNANHTAMDMTLAAAAIIDPRNVSYANSARVQGSSTACILSLNKERGALHAVNVGDNGFMVFRDSVVCTSLHLSSACLTVRTSWGTTSAMTVPRRLWSL
ncbi:unnamed protein product [Prunus brigantina]